LSAEGGSARQLTTGDFHHQGRISWSPDSAKIFFSANRYEDWEYEPRNSELYSLDVKTDELVVLTDRVGPDSDPAISPDGTQLAYTGLDDRYQGYQLTRLYVMDLASRASRCLSCTFDRSVGKPSWSADGKGLFVDYTDRGNGKIGYVSLDGQQTEVAGNLGGTSLGRPYEGGSFSVSDNDRVAFTLTRPDFPADVAVVEGRNGAVSRLTRLNEDLFGHKKLGEVEEIWFKSSFDERDLQGWIVKPPEFDASRKYPLILEIHGGPFADYGDRFAAEMQLYAAAGYVVLYMNPRGSTSYGEEFGNLIHHNYPSQDYDDLMSGVDAVIAKGYVDETRLYVTGGSGGGVLSSWIIGKTDRFKAAVVAKPVINWFSFVLTADRSVFFTKYWFPAYPWEEPEHYFKRSPISLVGNVKTPTMVLTGEADYRTPISESEQYYQALKLQKIDAVLVRIPEASHGITRRPSNLMAKVVHILTWFEKHF
ncbi:MAG: S9 family peptidase, partial [Acidobacteriota bacterium]